MVKIKKVFQFFFGRILENFLHDEKKIEKVLK